MMGHRLRRWPAIESTTGIRSSQIKSGETVDKHQTQTLILQCLRRWQNIEAILSQLGCDPDLKGIIISA